MENAALRPMDETGSDDGEGKKRSICQQTNLENGRKHLHKPFALNAFLTCGNKSVGPPVGLSGSGTKWGVVEASHCGMGVKEWSE